MWHRVAALLGGRTVEELQRAMTSAEFSTWCALFSFEPWGYEVENWRMGVIGATVANYSGMRKKPAKPSDFFPSRKAKRPQMNAEQLQAHMKAMVEKANG